MECVIGIVFRDFALIAADSTVAHSIIVVKNDENKIHKLNDNLAMAVCGEPGDTIQFAEYISKNLQLYKMRNGYSLSPRAAANFTRKNLADYLRSRSPYHVNLLLAGYDEQEKRPELYYMDYLATMVMIPYGAHGYGSFFSLGVLDRNHKPDMNEEEAVHLLRMCLAEVQKRFLISLPAFNVQLVDKNGIRTLPDITIFDDFSLLRKDFES